MWAEWQAVLDLFGWAIASTLLAGLVCPLVGALLLVGARQLDRVASVTQTLEADALHDATVPNVETGNDSASEHQAAFALSIQRASNA